MRHARSEVLDELEPLLSELRAFAELRERSRGVFYRGSEPFLHFHEDATGLFADVRLDQDFERRPVSSAEEQADLLDQVRRAL